MSAFHRKVTRVWPSRATATISLLAAFGLSGASAFAQRAADVLPPHAAEYPEAVEQARELANDLVESENLPGLSAAVGIDGTVVWAEGFGWADLEQRVPVTPLTKFRIGSVSKPLTSAAVGLLYERRRLDLDAPVQKYVPDFPEKRWPITTRQLMGHIAGVRHYRDGEFLSSKHYDGVLEGLTIFAEDELLFEPGTDYSYSSYGWNLVSAVVQEAAGEEFLDFMQQEVFASFGMRHTVPGYMARIVPDRVEFYVQDENGELRNAPWVDNSYKWAGGGFLSTPADLVQFGFGMLDGDVLEPETVELLWTSLRLDSGEATGYGLGWKVGEDEQGRRFAAHGGGSVGGTTSFVIYPDLELVIAVTTNLSDADGTGELAEALAAAFGPVTNR